MSYLPYVVFVIAFALGIAAASTEDPARQHLLVGAFALLLGVSMVLFGMRAVATGRVFVHREHAAREERPATFWITVVAFRFGIGGAFVAYGVWYLLQPPGA